MNNDQLTWSGRIVNEVIFVKYKTGANRYDGGQTDNF